MKLNFSNHIHAVNFFISHSCCRNKYGKMRFISLFLFFFSFYNESHYNLRNHMVHTYPRKKKRRKKIKIKKARIINEKIEINLNVKGNHLYLSYKIN